MVATVLFCVEWVFLHSVSLQDDGLSHLGNKRALGLEAAGKSAGVIDGPVQDVYDFVVVGLALYLQPDFVVGH